MKMDPETWRWIWLVAAAALTAGELAAPGSFFLLPFGVGAAVAAVASFAGLGVAWSWLIFVVVSLMAFLALRRVARRLDLAHSSTGVGAGRLIGRQARVVKEIPAGAAATGLIRFDGEEWRAESMFGHPIREGSTVQVIRIDGTRAVVTVLSEPEELEWRS